MAVIGILHETLEISLQTVQGMFGRTSIDGFTTAWTPMYFGLGLRFLGTKSGNDLTLTA
jgi:hypothetical protein